MTSPLANTYARLPVGFTHGRGVWLFDTEGKAYLDGLAGIGVSCLGHAHPGLVHAISSQAEKVIHTSNIYDVPLQTQLAQRIIDITGLDEVLFSNSGAEANEGAIKIARLYGHKKGNDLPTIITMESSWAGRTLGTLAATGSEKARQGFGPLPQGFIQVKYNDIEAVKTVAAKEPRVVAVLLEVLQGEGGIRPADAQYLKDLRTLCDQNEWLLMIDEVQSGIGRTGKWLAHHWVDVKPDVITLAKGLAGGVPIGAMVAGGRAKGVFTPGTHGTTFGGGPLVCAAGLAVFNAIEKEDLLDNARVVGDHLKAKLVAELGHLVGLKEIRGRGLMLGIELDRPCGILVQQALEAGLLINVTRDTVIRLLPPLIISIAEADQIVDRLAPLIKQFLDRST